MTEKTTILGVQFDNVDLDGAAQRTKELIETSNKSCKLIVAPNTEFIMRAQKDEEFFNILKSASFATPDSVGVMTKGAQTYFQTFSLDDGTLYTSFYARI